MKFLSLEELIENILLVTIFALSASLALNFVMELLYCFRLQNKANNCKGKESSAAFLTHTHFCSANTGHFEFAASAVWETVSLT